MLVRRWRDLEGHAFLALNLALPESFRLRREGLGRIEGEMDSDEDIFAWAYSQLWTGFARGVAPTIQEYVHQQGVHAPDATLLDIGCGTGELASHFASLGYRVIGIDRSEAMVSRAATNHNAPQENLCFVHRDVLELELPHRADVILSTYEVLNHLDDLAQLQQAFQQVRSNASFGALFLFDLLTWTGFQSFNNMTLRESQTEYVVTRGLRLPVGHRGLLTVTGFVASGGDWRRFEHQVINTAFSVRDAVHLLEMSGWHRVCVSKFGSFEQPLSDPEAEDRVWITARAEG